MSVPFERAFHETHEAGTDAAPARCGLVSRGSRGPRGSALRAQRPVREELAGRLRPSGYGRSECGKRKRGPGSEDAAMERRGARTLSPTGARVSLRGADRTGCATRRSIPSLMGEGQGKTGEPGAHAKEYGR